MNDQYFGSHEPKGGRAALVRSWVRVRICRLFGAPCGIVALQGGHALALLASLVAFLHASLLAPLNRRALYRLRQSLLADEPTSEGAFLGQFRKMTDTFPLNFK
jgi:hypothetical protein